MFRSAVMSVAATAAVAALAGGALLGGSGVAMASEPLTTASFEPANHPDRNCDPEMIRRTHNIRADDHESVRRIMRERRCANLD